MSPRTSHRRARRRSRAGRLVVLAAVLVVAAVLIGGVARIGPRSGPFNASVNRSFGAQGAVLADLSNATGSSLRRLMGAMPTQDRQTLQAGLDDVAAQAGDQSVRANALAGDGSLEGRFATVFADRARAANEVRSAIDGLLGMRPLPVSGAPAVVASETASTPLLSATQATNRITAAGRLLSQADTSYKAIRRSLADTGGHARLPASRWITTSSTWQIGAVAAQVDLVAASTTLEARHQLGLSVVQVTPPAIPSPTGVANSGVSVLSPTKTVTLNVVLTNNGSVDEPHAAVTFTLALQPSTTTTTTTTTTTRKRTASVPATRSTSLSPVTFSVKPGDTYQLSVAITGPAGQTAAAGTSFSEALQISPST
jgi:hypothetical protein